MFFHGIRQKMQLPILFELFLCLKSSRLQMSRKTDVGPAFYFRICFFADLMNLPKARSFWRFSA